MDPTISEFEQELKPSAGFMAIAFLGVAMTFTLLFSHRDHLLLRAEDVYRRHFHDRHQIAGVACASI
jgi:hypothetical protein